MEWVAGLGLVRLFWAALAVPPSEYAILASLLLCTALYHAMDFHFLHDLLRGLTGDPVHLLHSPSSTVASRILPTCKALHQRYLPTPWLSGPHLQTAFLGFFGRPPSVKYHRQLVRMPDGGTIALDWMLLDDFEMQGTTTDTMPIVVIIPGLTSDSTSVYVKHLANNVAKKGWRAVVANHRGLGGISITSDQVYNAGWTEDIRRIINFLHHEYSNAPLLAVGTSIGSNILVKYLGEEGDNTPLGAAVSVCNPWDLLVCERFLCQGIIQRLYNKMLAFGLRSFAQMNQHALAPTKHANWDLLSKSQSMRDFDNCFTVLVANYETVDTYYRKSSSIFYLNSVSIPLLGINSLDDPVCSKEAIPWDEARANPNVILGITRHGGHLAFFEGLEAKNIWWVHASLEFLSSTLQPLPMKENVPSSGLSLILESVIDKGPYMKLSGTGMASAENMCTKSVEEAEAFDDALAEYYQKNAQQIIQTDHLHPPASVDSSSDPMEKHVCNLNSSVEDDPIKNSPWNLQSKFKNSGTMAVADGELLNHFRKMFIKNQSDLLALELALSHLLLQVRSLKNSGQNAKVLPSHWISPQEGSENRSISESFLQYLGQFEDEIVHVDDAGSIDAADNEPSNHLLQMHFKNQSDILVLELALSHLLLQVESLKSSRQNGKVSPSLSVSGKEGLENRSFSKPFRQYFGQPATSAPALHINNGTEASTGKAGTGSSMRNKWRKYIIDMSWFPGKSSLDTLILKGIKGISVQNSCILCLLLYIAIIGSANIPSAGNILECLLNGPGLK